MISAMLIVSGCIKENCSRVVTTKVLTPIVMAKADARANAALIEAPQEIGITGKIYIKDDYIFVSEPGQGIHIIDNHNPAAPVKLTFIRMLGNMDMAVKGNILYADSFRDLLVFDISDPKNVRKIKAVNDVLGYSQSPQGFMIGYSYATTSDSIVIGYTSRDTTYTWECQASVGALVAEDGRMVAFSSSKAGASAGKGGSMARFTINKDHLYTVDVMTLRSFDLQNAADPVFREEVQIGWGIETIFPYGDNLFIGSTQAMYIFSLANPAKPERRSAVTHFRACDPVVVEGTTAYVTIRSGNACAGTFNQLQVFDVKDIDKPVKLATYEMKNPHGVGIDKGRLFVCEGAYGLRFMNAPSATNISTVKLLEGVNAYDVIPYDNANRLLVSARDGIYQYSYSSMSNPVLVSRINATNKER